MAGPYRFTTIPQKTGRESTLSWGGDVSWGDEINQNDGVEVTDGRVIPSTTADIPTTGLVGRWDFNAGSGTTVVDSAGSHDGTIHGATWVTDPNRDEPVLQFTGDGDYVSLDGWNGITGTQPRTWGIWFKSPNALDHRLISYGAQASGNKYDIRTDNKNSDSLRVENEDGQKYGSVTVLDGEWHFLTVVFPESGDSIQDHLLYVDAQLDSATGGGDQSLNTSTDTDVWFGKSHWHPDDTDGFIASVYAYDRALSQSEIQEIYDGTR